MRKIMVLLVMLVLSTACSNEVDSRNKNQASVDLLNTTIEGIVSIEPNFDDKAFFEKETLQFNSWKNNLVNSGEPQAYSIFKINGEIKILLFINGKFAYSGLNNLPKSYDEYYYDTLIYDDSLMEFRLFSSSMKAGSETVISLTD